MVLIVYKVIRVEEVMMVVKRYLCSVERMGAYLKCEKAIGGFHDVDNSLRVH
jgi:hypothetical protein